MFKFLGIKIPPYHFLRTLWAPLVPRQLWPRIHWEVWLEVTLTLSLFLVIPACPDNRLLERKPGLSTGFPSQPSCLFLHEKCGATIPAGAPAHWVEKDIAEYNVWPWGSVQAGYFVSYVCSSPWELYNQRENVFLLLFETRIFLECR